MRSMMTSTGVVARVREGFASDHGIPLASIRQYEIGRHMPPPATRAYLKVIEAEPGRVREVVGG